MGRDGSSREGAGREIVLYFTVLVFASGLGDPGGILNLPVLFILKDHFELGPQAVALFEVITFLPVYLGFLFGLLRDRWKPFGWGDRGYFLVAAPVAIGCYCWISFGAIDYHRLLTAILLAMVAYQMLDTAAQAMMIVVGQKHFMTGRLSALSEAGDTATGILSVLAGGWMAGGDNHRIVFMLAAAFTLAIMLQAFWSPRRLTADTGSPSLGAGSPAQATLRRMILYRPLQPTIAILVLWNFSPGWGTPFLYFLTDQIHLSPAAFGVCRALSYASVAASIPLYAWLCQRQPLKRLLLWVVLINVLPGLLFLVVTNVTEAYAVTVIVWLLGGCAQIAFTDLLMRCCPRDLEGTASAVGFSAFAIAGGVGDLFGSWLYDRGGFALCLLFEAAATAAILPVLKTIPQDLVGSPDGQQPV